MDEINIFNIIRHGKLTLYKKHIGDFEINTRSKDGQSLLHKAVAHSQIEISLDLIERSIDTNLQDKKGQTALHYLGFLKNAEVATIIAKAIIIRGGKTDLKDGYGNTPLWYASFNARGKYELVKFLMQSGANAFSKNDMGKSPIDFVQQIGDEKLLMVLLG